MFEIPDLTFETPIFTFEIKIPTSETRINAAETQIWAFETNFDCCNANDEFSKNYGAVLRNLPLKAEHQIKVPGYFVITLLKSIAR